MDVVVVGDDEWYFGAFELGQAAVVVVDNAGSLLEGQTPSIRP